MYLINFDGLALPNGDIKESYDNVEHIAQSEAGTDLGTVTRLMKLTLKLKIKCDGHLYSKIKQKAVLTSGRLQYRGLDTTARLRLESTAFEKYSELIDGADGLWTVSLVISEV